MYPRSSPAQALFLNDGARFTRSKAAMSLRDPDLLAVALMDATADGRPDALALSRDGTMTVGGTTAARGRRVTVQAP